MGSGDHFRVAQHERRSSGRHRRPGDNDPPTFYYRPPKRTCWQSFYEFLWNPRNHTACSRTPLNWLTITIYYAVFLCCVFGILYGSLQVVKWVAVTRDPNKPRYGLDESPIGSTPAVNFVPLETKFGPMVRLDSDVSGYVSRVDEFLGKYRDCEGSKCANLSQLGECGRAPYGYRQLQPCLYLRLTRIIEWKPVPYAADDSLPSEMPESVKEKVKKSAEQRLWVSCKGTTPLDRDHINETHLSYLVQGFDPSSFPFTKQKNYLDPFVVVRVDAKGLRNTLYSLTCYTWAKNMDLRKTGSEVLIFAKKTTRPLSETEKRLMREAFDLFDSNKDGFLDYYEFKASTRCLGFRMKKPELLTILHTYDRDNSNLISYEDFYEVMEEKTQKRDPADEVREAFKLIANEKTNSISFRDLKYAADRVGADIPERDLRRMIDLFDTKGEGKIFRMERYDWQQANRSTVLEGTEALLRTAESLERSQRIAHESERVGATIVSELGAQREGLERARENLHTTDRHLTRSRNLLRSMYGRAFANKFVLVLIILVEASILAALVYLKFFGRH